MATNAVVDNDILLKCACYRLLGEVLEYFGGSGSIGILGAARFVVRSCIERTETIRDRGFALQALSCFLSGAEELEPTVDEVRLATRMEEAAIEASVELDTGESQLCAILLKRSIPILVTGDKRAIAAADRIVPVLAELTGLAGKLACLEQLMMHLVGRIGYGEGRRRICAEPVVDKALSLCFACNSPEERPGHSSLEGLRSYINDLRSKAPTTLCSDDLLRLSYEETRHTAQ
jgi:hypothetical protein